MVRIGVFGVCLLAGGMLAQAAERQFKGQAEYDAYTAVSKDLAANQGQKALTDIDAWKQKFPDSDYKDDRTALTIQALVASNQPAKALDTAPELMGKDLNTALSGPGPVIKVLYVLSEAIQKVPDPTPQQLATGRLAAKQLAGYDKAPQGVAADAWAQARKDMMGASKAALLYTALVPPVQAMNRKDCDAAEAASRKAIDEFPDSAQAAWSLGSATLCLQKAHPEKASLAIYEFARAASLDPQKGMVDPKWQQGTAEPYLEKIYNQYHGTDADGLKQLKTLATASPLPPADFKLENASQIALAKEQAFEQSNPELALWMKIKGALTKEGGDQYFDSELKNSAVPQLKGTVVEAKPACHPKELMVAIKEPDKPLGEAEILLKFEKPLNGKFDVPADIQFEGVPSEFAASPFLLTMDSEAGKVMGLTLTPCTAAPVRVNRGKK